MAKVKALSSVRLVALLVVLAAFLVLGSGCNLTGDYTKDSGAKGSIVLNPEVDIEDGQPAPKSVGAKAIDAGYGTQIAYIKATATGLGETYSFPVEDGPGADGYADVGDNLPAITFDNLPLAKYIINVEAYDSTKKAIFYWKATVVVRANAPIVLPIKLQPMNGTLKLDLTMTKKPGYIPASALVKIYDGGLLAQQPLSINAISSPVEITGERKMAPGTYDIEVYLFDAYGASIAEYLFQDIVISPAGESMVAELLNDLKVDELGGDPAFNKVPDQLVIKSVSPDLGAKKISFEVEVPTDKDIVKVRVLVQDAPGQPYLEYEVIDWTDYTKPIECDAAELFNTLIDNGVTDQVSICLAAIDSAEQVGSRSTSYTLYL